jgi:hypothetical protein
LAAGAAGIWEEAFAPIPPRKYAVIDFDADQISHEEVDI